MEKSKRRLLKLLQIFVEETDVNHTLSTEILQDYLNQEGLRCERKTLYRDITALRESGIDIQFKHDSVGCKPGWYLNDSGWLF